MHKIKEIKSDIKVKKQFLAPSVRHMWSLHICCIQHYLSNELTVSRKMIQELPQKYSSHLLVGSQQHCQTPFSKYVTSFIYLAIAEISEK